MPRQQGEFQPVFRRVRFFWDRSASTDRWRDGESVGGGDVDRWLPVAPGVDEWSGQLNSRANPGPFYEPLAKASGLFHIFADLADDETALLGFARDYGPLGIPEPGKRALETYRGDCPQEWEDVLKAARDPDLGMPLSEDSLSVDDPTCPGERLSHWREAVSTMRDAVGLWEALRAGESGAVSVAATAWTRELIGQTVAATPQPAYLGKNQPTPVIEALPAPRPGAQPAVPVPLASTLLDSLIHAHLWTFGAVGFGAKGPERANVYFTSHNLLGALWLQFAMAVDGDKDFETCRGCGLWFEVGGGDKRARARHCSEACKVRAYRKRATEAGRLREAGHSVEKIAQLMADEDATTDKVERWLKAYDDNRNRGKQR